MDGAFNKIKFPEIKKIIAVASGKGGVGKSTISAEIAIALSKKGLKTAIFDADIYGPSIPLLFGLDDFHPDVIPNGDDEMLTPAIKDNIQIMSIGFLINESQPLIWRGPAASGYLKKLIIGTAWHDVDYLIIDLPPGTGDIVLTLCQEIPLDGAVIVTTPQKLSLSDVRKSLSMFKHQDINIPIIGIVENMSWFTPENHKDEKYYLFGKDGGTYLAEQFESELLAQIPLIEGLCDATNRCNINNFSLDYDVINKFNFIAETIVSKTQNSIPKYKENKAMKICIPIEEVNGLESVAYGHFGSAPYFLIYDFESKAFEILDNDHAKHEHGQCNPITPIKEKGVDTVIVAGMGARALMNLQSMSIRVFKIDEPKKISEIINNYDESLLEELSSNNCCNHHNCH